MVHEKRPRADGQIEEGESEIRSGNGQIEQGESEVRSGKRPRSIEQQIEEAESKIRDVEKNIERAAEMVQSTQGEFQRYWMEEKRQLRDEKRQLRDEKKLRDKERQLRDEKRQLRDKERQLRDKERQLRDKERQLRDEKRQLRDEKKTLSTGAGRETQFHFGEALTDVPIKIRDVVSDYRSGTLQLKKNKAGVTMFKGSPSMLLHYGDVSTERLANEVTGSLQRGTRTVILAGPSGCGKTKTLYSYFNTCPGFYFTVTAEGNGGSKDLSSMLSKLQQHLRPGEYVRNRLLARLHVLLLLASRVAIHKLCEGLSNKQWLLLQVVSRALCRGEEEIVEGSCDIFLQMYLKLAEEIPKDMSNEDLELNILELFKFVRGCVPHVAVDEAQILLRTHEKEFFLSESVPKTERPVSSSLFRAILDASCLEPHEEKNVLLVCGTGFTLYLHPDLVLSDMVVSKPCPSTSEYLWYGLWQTAADMVAFAEEVVKLQPQDICHIKTTLYKRFGLSRYRPFVSVVEQVLKGSDWIKAGEDVERVLTTKTKNKNQVEGVRGSIYDTIEAISKRSNGVLLMQILTRAVIQFFVFGRGLTLGGADSEDIIELIEFGLGVITKSALSSHCIEISEHLVLEAAKNFLKDTRGCGYFVADVLGDITYPSAQGFLYQHYVPLRLEELWDEFGGAVRSMPVFAAAFDEIPQNGDEYQAVASLGIVKLLRGRCCVAVHTQDYKTREFLLDDGPDKKCTTLVCEEHLKGGADLVTRFDGGTIFHQCKYYKHALTSRQFKLAVEKSVIGDRGLLALCGDFLIRMVDICPQHRPEGSPAFWWRKEGSRVILILILDADSGESFFKDHVEVLKAIKEGAPVLECFE